MHGGAVTFRSVVAGIEYVMPTLSLAVSSDEVVVVLRVRCDYTLV